MSQIDMINKCSQSDFFVLCVGFKFHTANGIKLQNQNKCVRHPAVIAHQGAPRYWGVATSITKEILFMSFYAFGSNKPQITKVMHNDKCDNVWDFTCV